MENSAVQKGLLFGYVKLPKSWAYRTWDEVRMSDDKLSKLKASFSKARLPEPPLKVFVQGNIGMLINHLLDEYEITDFYGIDFVEHFNNTTGDKSKIVIPDSKFVIIYNLGLEPALNLAFSSRILKSLLKELEQRNCYVLIQTDSSYTDIRRGYDIEFSNKVILPYKKEQVIDV